MVKTKEDKKKEILSHMEKLASNGKWVELSQDELVRRLADKEFDPKSVEHIIDELEKEETIKQDMVNFSIYYTKAFENDVKNKFQKHLVSDKMWAYIIAFFVVASSVDSIIKFLPPKNQLPSEYFTLGLFSVFFVFILGILILEIKNIFFQKIPVVKRYAQKIPEMSYVLFFIVLIITFSVVFIWSYWTGSKIELTHIIAILGIAFAAALGATFLTQSKSSG